MRSNGNALINNIKVTSLFRSNCKLLQLDLNNNVTLMLFINAFPVDLMSLLWKKTVKKWLNCLKTCNSDQPLTIDSEEGDMEHPRIPLHMPSFTLNKLERC